MKLFFWLWLFFDKMKRRDLCLTGIETFAAYVKSTWEVVRLGIKVLKYENAGAPHAALASKMTTSFFI